MIGQCNGIFIKSKLMEKHITIPISGAYDKHKCSYFYVKIVCF